MFWERYSKEDQEFFDFIFDKEDVNCIFSVKKDYKAPRAPLYTNTVSQRVEFLGCYLHIYRTKAFITNLDQDKFLAEITPEKDVGLEELVYRSINALTDLYMNNETDTQNNQRAISNLAGIRSRIAKHLGL